MQRALLLVGLLLGCLSLGCLVLGCGAKTGLSLPDAPMDAPPGLDAPPFDAPFDVAMDVPLDVPPDVPVDGCLARTIPLTPIRPEVMFVLDRLTSMSWALTGPDGAGPSRYRILTDALNAQLPRYDARSDMGVLLYPDSEGDTCAIAPRPQLAPGPDNASSVLALVSATGPGGRTPTAAALSAARSYFAARPDPTRARAVVLATDGAPNCNGALDDRTCRCTGGAGLPAGTCMGDSTLCLDDDRTVAVIAGLAAESVPTYVVGIDGDPDPALSAVLTRMANAGERPNPLDLARAYYSVSRPADLAAAFDRIQASIVSCTLALGGPIPSGRTFIVTLDGAPILRDPGRTEGWEFSESSELDIVLYGDTCVRAQDGVHVLTVELLCSP